MKSKWERYNIWKGFSSRTYEPKILIAAIFIFIDLQLLELLQYLLLLEFLAINFAVVEFVRLNTKDY
jgi:hypothetical protein